MRIARASVADASAIQTVLRETWLATYAPYLARATLDEVTAVWHDLELLKTRLADPDIYFAVARDESGGIAGFVTAQRSGDDLVIYRLYVRPDQQHQGVGTALYRETVRSFPGIKHVRLYVLTANAKGFAFWTKHGFAATAQREETVAGERIHMTEMEARIP